MRMEPFKVASFSLRRDLLTNVEAVARSVEIEHLCWR
jgi:hypothetical protein